MVSEILPNLCLVLLAVLVRRVEIDEEGDKVEKIGGASDTYTVVKSACAHAGEVRGARGILIELVVRGDAQRRATAQGGQRSAREPGSHLSSHAASSSPPPACAPPKLIARRP
ncbi:hypothetical protein EJB05_28909, partial [Eragrostis curvula]